jgi:hypothetical protein
VGVIVDARLGISERLVRPLGLVHHVALDPPEELRRLLERGIGFQRILQLEWMLRHLGELLHIAATNSLPRSGKGSTGAQL